MCTFSIKTCYHFMCVIEVCVGLYNDLFHFFLGIVKTHTNFWLEGQF